MSWTKQHLLGLPASPSPHLSSETAKPAPRAVTPAPSQPRRCVDELPAQPEFLLEPRRQRPHPEHLGFVVARVDGVEVVLEAIMIGGVAR